MMPWIYIINIWNLKFMVNANMHIEFMCAGWAAMAVRWVAVCSLACEMGMWGMILYASGFNLQFALHQICCISSYLWSSSSSSSLLLLSHSLSFSLLKIENVLLAYVSYYMLYGVHWVSLNINWRARLLCNIYYVYAPAPLCMCKWLCSCELGFCVRRIFV